MVNIGSTVSTAWWNIADEVASRTEKESSPKRNRYAGWSSMSEPYGTPLIRWTPTESAPAAQYGWYVRGRRFSKRPRRSG
eukprot:7357640-Prymnesium_polylepis.1